MIMIKLPCENCLTLAVCKSMSKKIWPKTEALKAIIKKCRIIEDYVYFNCAFSDEESKNIEERFGSLKYQSSRNLLNFFGFPGTFLFTRNVSLDEYFREEDGS